MNAFLKQFVETVHYTKIFYLFTEFVLVFIISWNTDAK